MDELIAFITARLDEDEAAAKACPHPEWRASGPARAMYSTAVPWTLTGDGHILAEGISYHDPEHACLIHAARHDPARALREVAAKRRLIAGHGPGQVIDDSGGKWRSDPDNWDPPVTMCPGHEWVAWPCETARIVAAVWSTHPDYRDEWKP